MKEFNKSDKKMINMNFENEKDIFVGDTSTIYNKIFNLKEKFEKQEEIKVSLLFYYKQYISWFVFKIYF